MYNDTETNQIRTTEHKGILPLYECGKDQIEVNGWRISTDVSTHEGIQKNRKEQIENDIPIDYIYGGFTESPQMKVSLINKIISALPIPIEKNGLSVLGTAWPLVFIDELNPQKMG